ncbi:MAG: peptidoglycan DD-metalloendopeptidase family protein [Tissierellia bacterium]|nr:peptidoglycan DD-metalloendopeptidase family protein [Tissierellia bacterium]
MEAKQYRRLSIALASVMVLGHTSVFAESLQEQKNQKIREQQSIQGQMDSTQGKINEVQGQVASVRSEIAVLDGKISQAAYELQQLNNEIALIQEQIEITKRELEQEREKLAKKQDQFSKRLRAMYIADDTGYLDVLLSSDNVEDLIGNAKMIREIAKSDQDLIAEINAQIKIIEEKQRQLEEQQALLRAKQQEVAAKKASLEEANRQKNAYMGTLVSDLNAYELQYNQMVEESNALQSEINRIQNSIEEQERLAKEAQRLERERAAREKARQEALKSQSSGQKSKVSPTKATVISDPVVDAPKEPIASASRSGGMVWPVPGHSRVSSPYGYRIHPILKVRKFHSGIDIPAPSGTPIAAADDGVVIASSNMRGYGNCVMVDHGDGKVTVYAHASSRAVQTGQKVVAGQTIAYVGSTGMSTGPHLHFEVRVGGSTTNPLNYL